MKKVRFSLVLIVLLTGGISFAKYSGGTGEPNDPYRIATPNDLNDIGNHVEDFNKCFVMVNDINMAGFTYTTAVIAPDTNSTYGFQGTAFTGIFDGNDCNIINLTIDTADANNDYLGLLGKTGTIDEHADITNVVLENCIVSGSHGSKYIGALIGHNYEGDVTHCKVVSSVYGMDHVGGLVGHSYSGYITNCSAEAVVIGSQYSDAIGGLVGFSGGAVIAYCYAAGTVDAGPYAAAIGGLVGRNEDGGHITHCHAMSNVSCSNGSHMVGGLVGYDALAEIESCYVNANVTGREDSDWLGGLVGYTGWGTIIKCFATGTVEGDECLGGLVGTNIYGSIIESYSSCDVNGANTIGGLVGANSEDDTIRCFSVGNVYGKSSIGGLIGHDDDCSYLSCFWDSDVNPDVNGIGNASDPNVIGKTTPEMMTESTFTDVGWDFVEAWDIGENQTYPFLRKHSAGDLNHSGLVDWRDIGILAGHWLEGQ